MSRNYELDRLKAEEESAFQRKQEAYRNYEYARDRANGAYDAMQDAWEERVLAREKMNQEFEDRKSAFEHHDSIWEDYGRIRDDNNSQIEALKYDADSEHHAMQDCFDRASEAYEYGDKSEAPMWSREGHEHKERRDELNAEISRLAQEVKDARAHAEFYAPRVDSSAFEFAKNEFEKAKSLHESAQAKFKSLRAQSEQLKSIFDVLHTEHLQCKEAFQGKLEEIKADNQRKRDKILDKAEIYGSVRKDAKIVEKADKTVQVYYGGIGKGDGLGHGHASIDKSSKVTYHRKAFAKHGSQNFKDNKRPEKDKKPENNKKSGWEPFIRGTIGDQEVTLRVGIGRNAGQTLICDGCVSRKQFKKGHNHYGANDKKRYPNEPDRIEDSSKHKNDNYYTGPGH